MWALMAREITRFKKIWADTIFTPIISMALFLLVFGVVAGGNQIDGIPFTTFVYTGLLCMIMVNSSFNGPTFSLIISKNVGTLLDLQIVPIAPYRVGLAYAASAITRALVTLAIAILATIWFIPGIQIYSIPIMIFALLLTGLEFGMLGVAFGMWAKNFESLTFVTSFVLQPMIFLAGVFYPIANLPAPFDVISQFNPLHHNINLFRYGVLGYSDATPMISLAVLVIITILVFVFMTRQSQKCLKP